MNKYDHTRTPAHKYYDVMHTHDIHMCIIQCHVYYTAKLAGRAQKVAHFMLRKLGGGRAVKPGDRVALVFRPDEAPSFVSAFYGCIIAAVIPVCIEPPITKEVCVCLWVWVLRDVHM